MLKKIGKLHDFSAGLVIGGKVCDMSKIVFKSDILHKENSKTHLYGTQKSRKLLLQGSFFFPIPLFEHCYVPFIRSKFHWLFFFHDDFLTVAEGRNGQNKPNQHHHLYPRKTVTAHGRNLQLHSRLTTDSW